MLFLISWKGCRGGLRRFNHATLLLLLGRPNLTELHKRSHFRFIGLVAENQTVGCGASTFTDLFHDLPFELIDVAILKRSIVRALITELHLLANACCELRSTLISDIIVGKDSTGWILKHVLCYNAATIFLVHAHIVLVVDLCLYGLILTTRLQRVCEKRRP